VNNPIGFVRAIGAKLVEAFEIEPGRDYPMLGVYFAFRDGQPLYVGMGDIGSRVSCHLSNMRRRRRGWHRRVSPQAKPSELKWIGVRFSCPYRDVQNIEAALIALLKPPGNAAHPSIRKPEAVAIPGAVPEPEPPPPPEPAAKEQSGPTPRDGYMYEERNNGRWVNPPRFHDDGALLSLYERW
jgi:hypothetical protein